MTNQSKLKRIQENPPSKVCPICYHLWYNGQRVCGYCAFEFYASKGSKND